MPKITMDQLGTVVQQTRGSRGLRATAREIGISPATLSRVESGKQPDLETFSKLCQWLKIDANEVLGCPLPSGGDTSATSAGMTVTMAHFRADKTMRPETARHLGELILAVQRAALARQGGQG